MPPPAAPTPSLAAALRASRSETAALRASRSDLTELITRRRILVCVGSGGVGKTTMAATLALTGALLGKRTLVLTIDPARRLADSLGLSALGHDIQRVPEEVLSQVAAARGQAPIKGGSLDAMMLDQKRAFDEVVERYARDQQVKRRILDNVIYQQISTTLAGSHEYAAMSKLYDIAQRGDPDSATPGGRYDLIVLDTPPTENALDFLDAPDRVSQAIDSPAIQWFIKPYLAAGTFSLKLVGMGGAFVLKGLARFVGSEFLAQMAQFFVEFNQVLGGFRERARAVFDLMRQPDVGFVLVCSPEPLSVDEALYFHDRLRTSKMPLGGFVVNRLHQEGPQTPGRQELIDLLHARPELRGFSDEDLVQVAADLDRTYREQQVLAGADALAVSRLSQAANKDGTGVPLCSVPIFEQDIYGAPGLALVSRYLVS